MQFQAGNKIPSVVFFAYIFYTHKNNATCLSFIPLYVRQTIRYRTEHSLRQPQWQWQGPGCPGSSAQRALGDQEQQEQGGLPRGQWGSSKGGLGPRLWAPGKGTRWGQARKPKEVVRKAGASVGHSGGKGCQAGLKWGSWVLSREAAAQWCSQGSDNGPPPSKCIGSGFEGTRALWNAMM